MRLNVREWLNNLIFLCFIYLNGSLWAVDGITGRLQFTLKIILALFVIILERPKIKKKHVKFVLALLAMMMCTIATAGLYFDLDVAAILNLLLALIFVSSYNEEEFIGYYCNVMRFLAGCSLVGFSLYYIAKEFLMLFPQVVWHAGIRFANLFVTLVPLSMNDYFRNWGIFREPGFYAVFLVYALTFELFAKSKMRKRTVYMEILALLTTFSTSGIVALAILLFAFFMNKKTLDSKDNKKLRRKIIIGTCIVLGLVASWMMFTYNGQRMFGRIFGKVFSQRETNMSYINRQLGIENALEIFEDHMLFGGGYISVVGSEIDFTELLWFALYGVLYGIICNLYYLIYPTKYGNKMIARFLLMCVFFVVGYSQAIESSMMTFVFLLYSFDYGIRKWTSVLH